MKKRSEKAIRKRRLNRRGVTIAETVVAMAVIIMVSFTAITVIRRASVTTMEDQYNWEAINLAENAKQCMIYADDAEDFAAAFSSLFQAEEGDTVRVDSTRYWMSITRDTYTVTISVSYESSTPSLYAFCTSRSSTPGMGGSKVLYSLNYQKASQEGHYE